MNTSRAWLRFGAISLACLCIVACGSDKSADADDAAPANADAATTPSLNKPTSSATGLGPWVEYASAPSKPAYPFNSAFAVPPPAPATDPDVAIERYIKECSGGANNAACQSLKAEVEGAFLEALLAVRASDEPVDPEWYRVAAAADSPQLACTGVNELAYLPGRTSADEALIAKALDHPAPSVRAAAMSLWQKIPAVGDVAKRWEPSAHRTSGTCLDAARDSEPSTQWAGDYPGAKFRALASTDARRWYTTGDSVAKVTGWFAKSGKPAKTSKEMAAEQATRFTEEMTRISSSQEPNAEARMMELMQQMASGGGQNWDQEFRGMEGIGEVKYVMLAPGQALAVFSDEIFKGTSLVALRPAQAVDLTPDIEKATREATARSILGY